MSYKLRSTGVAILALLVCLVTPALLRAAGAFEADEHTALLLHLDGNIETADQSTPNFRTVGSLQWQQGVIGQGLTLDGKSGFSAMLPSVLAMGQKNQSWTLEAWIKPQKAKQNTAIISAIAGYGRIVALTIDAQGQLALKTSASPYDLAGISSNDASAVIYDGKWHHVAAVIDRQRNGELRLYLDGKQLKTNAAYQHYPIFFDQTSFSVTIGAIAPWYIAKAGYLGDIDEVRISSVARYAAAADAPAPEAAPAELPPLQLNASDYQPLRITADNVAILTPRFATADEIRAAGMIRDALAQALKVEPKDIFAVPDQDAEKAKGRILISIGRTRALDPKDLEPLESQGYLIKRKGNAILLATRDPQTMPVATEAFMSQMLGVRHYLPFKLFFSDASTKPIVVTDLNIVSNPQLQAANSTGYSYYPDIDWVRMMGLVRHSGLHQHSMYVRFPPEKYAKKYPKIYPTINGKYYVPTSGGDQRWEPTFSEPTLVDAALESMDDFFTQNPDAAFISFSVMDSHFYSDLDYEQPICKELGKQQGVSVLYWTFMNELAKRAEKKYPDKKIVGIAYSYVRFAPTFVLHKNIVPWLQWKLSDETASQVVTPWSKVTRTIGIHDWAQGSGFFIPRIYTNKLKNAFLDVDKMGLSLRYAHGEAYPNWGLDGPKLYMMAQIWWNPHVDVDKLLQQFSDDMFGGASKPMYEYFKILENLFLIMNQNQERKIERYYSQFILTSKTRPLAAKARTLLDQAVAMASTPQEKQRIELFNKTFKLSEMFFELSNKPFDQALADQIVKYANDVIYTDPMTVYTRATTPAEKIKAVERAISQIKSGAKKIAEIRKTIEAKQQ